MSDATTDNGPLIERRRALASFAAAFVLHAALIAALALGLGIGAAAAPTPPMTIDLRVSSEPGADARAGPAGAGGVLSTPGAGPTVAVAPAAGAASASPGATAVGSGSDSSGFVIPTPRVQHADSTTAGATGPSSREAGGRTGAAQGIPSVPSSVPAPTVPAARQGNSGSAPSSTGAGASSVQRSGSGVLVTGGQGSAAGGPLDVSKLEKAFPGDSAGRAGGGTTTGGGGSAAGSSATGGGSAGSTGAGGGAGSGQGYNISWEGAGSGHDRTLVFSVLPKIPSWVSAQGLALSVAVSFTVLPDGTVSGAATQQSSGYPEVDAAVIDAIRRCRFSPAPGAPLARGITSYIIRVR